MPTGVYEKTAEHKARLSAAQMGKQNAKTHGMEGTPTYKSWDGARSRCNNPNATHYHRYGGRGIQCELTFEEFFAEVGERPEGTSIDRIDNSGNYEVGNMRWATRSEQEKNKGHR